MKWWKPLLILLLCATPSWAGFWSNDPGVGPGTLVNDVILDNSTINSATLNQSIINNSTMNGTTVFGPGSIVNYDPSTIINGPNGSTWTNEGITDLGGLTIAVGGSLTIPDGSQLNLPDGSNWVADGLSNLNLAPGGVITIGGLPAGGACAANQYYIALSSSLVPTCAPITSIPGPVTISSPTFTGSVTMPDGGTWTNTGIMMPDTSHILIGFVNITGTMPGLTFNNVPMGGSCNTGDFVNSINANGVPSCGTPSGGGGSLPTPVSVGNGGLGQGVAPNASQILVASGPTAYNPVTMTGDATINSSGAITVVSVGGVAGPFLRLAGGTLTGPLTLSANAASALQAVPLQQVQSLIAAIPPPAPPAAGSITDAMLSSSYSGVGACTGGQLVSGLNRNAPPTCVAPPSGFTAGGDLSGTSTTQTVIGIRSTSVPALASGYLHYNGSAFVWDTPSTGAATSVGTTAPASPVIGQLWFNTADLQTYIWYNDGTSSQWTAIVNQIGSAGTGGGVGTVTSIVAGAGLTGGTITSSGTISLNTANANTWSAVQTFSSAPVMSGASITSGTIPMAAMANSGVTAGSYTNANITVNAMGIVTAAANGTAGGGGVTSITAGTGLTGGTITTTGTIALAANPAGGALNFAPIASPTFTGSATSPQLNLTNSSGAVSGLRMGGGFASLTNIIAGTVLYAGAHYTGSAWQLDASQSVGLGLSFQAANNAVFYQNSGTAGNTFTPTVIATIDATGINLPTGSSFKVNGTAIGGGGVTSIAAGTGLTGGTITTTGTIALATPVAIANGGTGLTTAPLSGQILVGQTNNTYSIVSVGGDVTLSPAGATSVMGLRGTLVPAITSGYLHYNGSALVWDTPASGGVTPVTGTWVPVLTASGATFTYSYHDGSYYCLGKLCYVTWEIGLSGASGTGSALTQITGLPFTAFSTASGDAAHMVTLAGGVSVTANSYLTSTTSNGQTYLLLNYYQTGSSTPVPVTSNSFTSSAALSGAFTYQTD